MAYLTALLLIDAPASALNNSGEPISNARTDNTSSVKFIRKTGAGSYPYATAQAYRRWLRDTLAKNPDGWQMSPVYREEKVAYVDANPLIYWDDDLLGYMRAPSKKKDKANSAEGSTPVGSDVSALTRTSPLRVSTLVAVSPVHLTNDFGVMARQDGDPVPFEHQFYRATLQGLLSLDMSRAGVFTYTQRTGHQNLDSNRRQQAEQMGLAHDAAEKTYRLPVEERMRRVRRLIEAIPLVQGGAKQTLHYTDVTPVVTIAAITKYGNHPFNYLFEDKGETITFKIDAFEQILRAYADQFLGNTVYVGWRPGYAQNEYAKFNGFADTGVSLVGGTPHETFNALSVALAENPAWLE